MPEKHPNPPEEAPLAKRETQIMDLIYRLGAATAREVMNEMTAAPSYSTVRAQLGLLVAKGHLLAAEQAGAYVYRPARPKAAAAESSLRRVLRTFFDGSVANAVSGLLSLQDQRLTAEEIDRLEEMLAASRKEGSRE